MVLFYINVFSTEIMKSLTKVDEILTNLVEIKEFSRYYRG